MNAIGVPGRCLRLCRSRYRAWRINPETSIVAQQPDKKARRSTASKGSYQHASLNAVSHAYARADTDSRNGRRMP